MSKLIFKSGGSTPSYNGLLDFDSTPSVRRNDSGIAVGVDAYLEYSIYFDKNIGFPVANQDALVMSGAFGTRVEGNNGKILYFYDAGGTYDTRYDIPIPSLNTWHTIKLIWTQSTTNLELYVDNILQSQTVSAMTTNNNVDGCAIRDIDMNGSNYYLGYPNGNTNAAWVDTIGSVDLTVQGGGFPTTRDISGTTSSGGVPNKLVFKDISENIFSGITYADRESIADTIYIIDTLGIFHISIGGNYLRSMEITSDGIITLKDDVLKAGNHATLMIYNDKAYVSMWNIGVYVYTVNPTTGIFTQTATNTDSKYKNCYGMVECNEYIVIFNETLNKFFTCSSDSSGNLTEIDTLTPPAGTGIQYQRMHTSGNFVYNPYSINSNTDMQLRTYSVDGSGNLIDNSITYVITGNTAHNTTSYDIHIDGDTFLYVDKYDNGLLRFSINPTTGALTQTDSIGYISQGIGGNDDFYVLGGIVSTTYVTLLDKTDLSIIQTTPYDPKSENTVSITNDNIIYYYDATSAPTFGLETLKINYNNVTNINKLILTG